MDGTCDQARVEDFWTQSMYSTMILMELTSVLTTLYHHLRIDQDILTKLKTQDHEYIQMRKHLDNAIGGKTITKVCSINFLIDYIRCLSRLRQDHIEHAMLFLDSKRGSHTHSLATIQQMFRVRPNDFINLLNSVLNESAQNREEFERKVRARREASEITRENILKFFRKLAKIPKSFEEDAHLYVSFSTLKIGMIPGRSDTMDHDYIFLMQSVEKNLQYHKENSRVDLEGDLPQTSIVIRGK